MHANKMALCVNHRFCRVTRVFWDIHFITQELLFHWSWYCLSQGTLAIVQICIQYVADELTFHHLLNSTPVGIRPFYMKYWNNPSMVPWESSSTTSCLFACVKKFKFLHMDQKHICIYIGECTLYLVFPDDFLCPIQKSVNDWVSE